jgi:hypothetical protein
VLPRLSTRSFEAVPTLALLSALLQQIVLDLREVISNDDTFWFIPAYANPAAPPVLHARPARWVLIRLARSRRDVRGVF